MEDKSSIFAGLLQKLTDYGNTTLELTKLKALEKSAEFISSAIPQILGFAVFVIFLLMLSIGLALWLGNILGGSFVGFFAVAGLYGLIFLVLTFLLHKWIKMKIANYFVKMMLK
jgi:hypothetical protein